ncbi:hypothetical protein B0T24DRAFT_142705 [Lasiosphaeria ovina]|uniref:Uncharacterized protein n=1 Tax=Lasiosphaeria ovina TaxID=92902 RepID=A0AAE0KMF2_9PEZI|nr:hypothetical protein B0T24DRAFT_142705 [Lasiosphaeria ovina]
MHCIARSRVRKGLLSSMLIITFYVHSAEIFHSRLKRAQNRSDISPPLVWTKLHFRTVNTPQGLLRPETRCRPPAPVQEQTLTSDGHLTSRGHRSHRQADGWVTLIPPGPRTPLTSLR